MLNRNAESMYWLGRYLERAENHVRFLDAYLHMPYSDVYARNVWPELLDALGNRWDFDARFDSYARENIVQFLTLDPKLPNSITSCVGQARQNLRDVRDKLPLELWDTVNGLYLWLHEKPYGDIRLDGSHRFFRTLRERLATVYGLSVGLMPRDDRWHVMNCGRALERAENANRMLRTSTRFDVAETERYAIHLAVLKSMGGYETFRRSYFDAVTPTTIAQFIMTDEQFPRSILHSVTAMNGHLKRCRIDPHTDEQRGLLRYIDLMQAELACLTPLRLSESEIEEAIDSLSTRFEYVGRAIQSLYVGSEERDNHETGDFARHTLPIFTSGVGECQ